MLKKTLSPVPLRRSWHSPVTWICYVSLFACLYLCLLVMSDSFEPCSGSRLVVKVDLLVSFLFKKERKPSRKTKLRCIHCFFCFFL